MAVTKASFLAGSFLLTKSWEPQKVEAKKRGMSKYIKVDLCLAYEVHGEGVPILLIAPGGLRSERGMWSNSPIDPVATLRPYF